MLLRHRSSRLIMLLLAFAFGVILSLQPWLGMASEPAEALLQQSRQHYEAGQLDAAKAILQQVQQHARNTQNPLVLAVALSNLALIEGNQGNWAAANQAIVESIQAVQNATPTADSLRIHAQVLSVQARLQLDQGNAQTALQTWQRVTTLYQQGGDRGGEIQSQLRQVQALQRLGLQGQAYQDILQPLQQALQQQPDSVLKAWGLRSLSETISLVKTFDEAQKVAQESLGVAERLRNPQEIAASQLTLANLLYAKVREVRNLQQPLRTREKERLTQDTDAAIQLYQTVAATNSPNRLRAQLNQLALLIDSEERTPEATQLADTLRSQITALPPNRSGIEARLNFANSWLRLQKLSATSDRDAVMQLLADAVTQASAVNDQRLLANALGNLGRAQEHYQQLNQAQTSTAQAVMVATRIDALDQIYRWSAQLGRLQEQQSDRTGAIASYTKAVRVLPKLRLDLLSLTSDALLVDPDALKPVHRQLVNLLLPEDPSQADTKTLKLAREIIESLQVEEITNFLRSACNQVQAIDEIKTIAKRTTIIYPILLPNRIAIITNLIGQEPQLYTQSVSQATVEKTVKEFQEELRNQISLDYQQPSQQLYDWLIKPIAASLQQQDTETLVFVLDGVLRNVPMAALSDGEQFLIEKYSIAVTPGLTLTNPQPLQAKILSSVAFGLTEASTVRIANGEVQSFSELPSVKPELENLQEKISGSTVKLNEQFTSNQFQQTLQTSESPIVHLATHGQFSSNREQTFLVAWNGETIDIDTLSKSLGGGDARQTNPIELLVLSACETAKGDDKAPLGLAGIALKSGARSTIASLWKVSDESTSLLMQRLYQELATRQVTKADALQRAQRTILDNPDFRRHPYYWAPFILVGNWL